MTGTLVMPLGKCIDAVDGTIILSELFFGDRYPLFCDRIENVEVPALILCICHVPLLGVRAKRRQAFGYAAAKACWPKSKRISVLTFDRCIPYSRCSMIDVAHPGGEILAWHQGC
jgi:hypothetical protein